MQWKVAQQFMALICSKCWQCSCSMQDHCHSHNLAFNTSNLSSAYMAEDQSETNVVVTWPIGHCLAKPVFEISTDEPVLKETAQDLSLLVMDSSQLRRRKTEGIFSRIATSSSCTNNSIIIWCWSWLNSACKNNNNKDYY